MTIAVSLGGLPGSPRLAYVMDVLCERYGWVWAYAKTIDPAAGTRVPGETVALHYACTSTYDRSAGLGVRAHGLLSAPRGSAAVEVEWGSFRGVPCPTRDDPIAGVFYALALLGDYRDRPTDAHGRLPAATHPLYVAGLGRVPVADRLLGALAQSLWHAGGREGAPPLRPEASAATSDIDAPRALAGKSVLRRASSLVRGFASVARERGAADRLAIERALRHWRGESDPFDNFAYMHAAAASRGLPEDFFTLVGYGTRLDPGWRRRHPAWGRFWRKLPAAARLGIHPSYYASERPGLTAAETAALRAATGRPVVASRQHFLRFQLPDTFRELIACGIREDHSVMWADADGFRAGTARSFLWYDVRREEVTDLRLFPPHAMDVTARYYRGLSPAQAVASWSALAAEARASGTGLRCIWHNSNLGPWYGWGPWRAAYEAALDLSTFTEAAQPGGPRGALGN